MSRVCMVVSCRTVHLAPQTSVWSSVPSSTHTTSTANSTSGCRSTKVGACKLFVRVGFLSD